MLNFLGKSKHMKQEIKIGELRSLLAKPASDKVFRLLSDLIQDQRLDDMTLDYVLGRLAEWPLDQTTGLVILDEVSF